jgi:hypothetical protein
MTRYTIIAAVDGSGFQVGVVGGDGARHTILGFESVAEAESWILHGKRLNPVVDPVHEHENAA